MAEVMALPTVPQKLQLLSFFSNNISQKKLQGIVRVQGERADHQTTTIIPSLPRHQTCRSRICSRTRIRSSTKSSSVLRPVWQLRNRQKWREAKPGRSSKLFWIASFREMAVIRLMSGSDCFYVFKLASRLELCNDNID